MGTYRWLHNRCRHSPRHPINRLTTPPRLSNETISGLLDDPSVDESKQTRSRSNDRPRCSRIKEGVVVSRFPKASGPGTRCTKWATRQSPGSSSVVIRGGRLVCQRRRDVTITGSPRERGRDRPPPGLIEHPGNPRDGQTDGHLIKINHRWPISAQSGRRARPSVIRPLRNGAG